MRKICLFSALLLLPILAAGQTNPIEDEILNYSSSKSDIISKGRRLLLDSFIADDLDKVEEVKDYLLNEVEDDNYTALYPAEQWLLMYWTEEFEELLSSLKSFNKEDYQQFQNKITPAQDMMFANLRGKSLVWEDKLEWKIRNASLEAEEKDLLRLNLAWLLADENEEDYLEKLNQRASAYLAIYPESEYQEFVRQELRYSYVPTNWGFGFELYSGYGMLTGDLGTSFSNPLAFGVGFDLEYKEFSLFTRITAMGGEVSETISNRRGTVWLEGEPANTFHGDLSIGYELLDSDKIKISPFVGVGIAEITAPDNDLKENPDLEHLKLGTDITYSIGANLDFKLGWKTGEIIENEKTYWYLRLHYGYVMPQFGNPQGNMHLFTIGLGGLIHGTKREL